MSIGRTDGQIVLLYFDALTVAIPVTLMISLIISSMYSASKLEELDIYVRYILSHNYTHNIYILSLPCYYMSDTYIDTHNLHLAPSHTPSTSIYLEVTHYLLS